MSGDISSDTPLFFVGGPQNERVERWGLVPRGRMITCYDPEGNHIYSFYFFKGPGDEGIEAVIARYEGRESKSKDD